VHPVTSGDGDQIYLKQIVAGKGARKIVTDKGAQIVFDCCLLKFSSRSQVFGSFAHKIVLGGFFSSLSSDSYNEDNLQ
jgi:hypothetical protein